MFKCSNAQMFIIGHQKQWQYLKRIADSEKIPHALLFSGQEKLGKKTVALEFISLLFKESPIHHPDFVLIEPKDQQIQIDQIRDLSWRLSLKPIKSLLKAAIIDEAHLMTEEAQNCFLKTLEEPKGKTILILITEYPNSLLPTILSRCGTIKFYPVKKQDLRNYLIEKGLTEEKIGKILEFSLGNPGLAIDFLENPEKLKEREEKIREIIKISKIPYWARFQYAKDLVSKSNLREVLEIWLNYFRSILLKECLKSDFKHLGEIEGILKTIQRTFFLISTTNVNPRLALEVLMMEL